MGWALVWGILACAALAVQSAAQDTSATARRDSAALSYSRRLLGVFDAETGLPVADAEVIDVLSGTSARTTRTGTVSLSFVSEGVAIVRVRKLGYVMRTIMVATSPVDTVPITMVLQPVVQLPVVTTYGRRRYISPRLRAFEERRLTGATGYFLSEEELRKEDGRLLADVLRSRIPGVRISESGFHMLLLPSPRCMGGGPPDVFVDGMPWPHPMDPDPPPRSGQRGRGTGDSIITAPRDSVIPAMPMQPIDLSDFQVWDLAGIEYYPDDLLMPPQFRHTPGACGALLLWTRER
jgi:hypothetical protein